MGLETGWNCHISLTPNGDSPCDGAPSSPSQGSLHEDLNQGSKPVSEAVLSLCTEHVSLNGAEAALSSPGLTQQMRQVKLDRYFE